MCSCVLIVRNFASNNLIEATPEEVDTAFEGYISYCGSYEVNEQERFVIHRLELSWFPNLVGTEQKRFFEFAGDRLTLADTAPDAAWRRPSPPPHVATADVT